MLILQKQWGYRPQEPIHAASSILGLRASTIWTPEHATHSRLAAYSVGPQGPGISSTTDNVLQVRRDPVVQIGDASWFVVSFVAGVYAASSGYRRIIATRGTAAGDGNRRGWEMIFYRGSLSTISLQVFNSGGRTSADATTTFVNPADNAIITIAGHVRRAASTTYVNATVCVDGVPTVIAEFTVGALFGDDGGHNYLELAGEVAGFATYASGPISMAAWGPGITDRTQQSELARNPSIVFEHRPIEVLTAAGFPTGPRIHYVVYPSSETRFPQQDDVVKGWPGVATTSGYEKAPTSSQDFTFQADASALAGLTTYKIAYCWYDGLNYSPVEQTTFTTLTAGIPGVPTLSAVALYNVTTTTARPRVTITF